MPATYGSVTPSVAATATAASAAVPPSRSTSSPAAVDWTVLETTAPPVPVATGCFTGMSTRGAGPATAGTPNASAVDMDTMPTATRRRFIGSPLGAKLPWQFYRARGHPTSFQLSSVAVQPW